MQSLYAHGEIKYFFWYRETSFGIAVIHSTFLLCRWVFYIWPKPRDLTLNSSRILILILTKIRFTEVIGRQLICFTNSTMKTCKQSRSCLVVNNTKNVNKSFHLWFQPYTQNPSYVPPYIERKVRIISQQNFTKWKFHGMVWEFSVEKVATWLNGVDFWACCYNECELMVEMP